MSNVFGITARAFRWYADGDETTAVALEAENTDHTILVIVDSVVVQLRYGVQESGSGSSSGATTDDYQLQVSLNSGAYQNVTAISTIVQSALTALIAEGDATTERLSAGSGNFVAGKFSEDGLIDDWRLTANNYSDLLFSLKVLTVGTAAGDTLDFRVLRNGAVFDTYSVTPRLVVSETLPTIEGTSSITEDGDTSTATASSEILGTSSITEDGDTSTATGVSEILGTSSITEAGDTSTATGVSEILGTSSITEAGDTVDSDATVEDVTDITAVVSITEAGDTSTATGVSEILGTSSITEAGDTSTATASSEVLGTASLTEAGDTSTATGVSEILATASITEAGDTLASTAAVDADDIEATASITEAGDTSTATGVSEILGTASLTEAGDTSTATASSEILATANITETGDTLVASGGDLEPVECDASITEADDTLDAYAFWMAASESSHGRASFNANAPGVKVADGSATGVVVLVNEGKVR